MADRDLFANFDRMRREMDELLGGGLVRSGMRRRAGFSPPVDVAYTSDPPTAIVTVEVAGVAVEDLDLEIQGRQVIVSGHRRGAAAEECVYQQVEIERGPFRRVVTLAGDVVADGARAGYQDGMLRIEIPLRAAAGRSRTVPIEGAER